MAEDDVHRLRDIQVEEVSLVDRAANKRRFLVVKREGDMSELRSDGHGGFHRVRKADDEDPETAKAKPPPFGGNKAPPFGKKPPGAAPKDDEEPKDDPEAKRKAADEAPDDEPDEADKRKAAAAAAKRELAKTLAEVVSDLGEVAQKMDNDEEDEDDVTMRKVLAAHQKLGAMASALMKRTSKSAVVKIGRKMSAARLAMFKESLATLQSLLTELMDSPKKEKDHDAEPGDPQVPPPGWKAGNPSGAPSAGKGQAAIKGQLEKALGELVTLVKGHVASQQETIARLQKGVVPSQTIPVDGVKKRGAPVAWPVDMNARPRDNKDVSFLDD